MTDKRCLGRAARLDPVAAVHHPPLSGPSLMEALPRRGERARRCHGSHGLRTFASTDHGPCFERPRGRIAHDAQSRHAAAMARLTRQGPGDSSRDAHVWVGGHGRPTCGRPASTVAGRSGSLAGGRGHRPRAPRLHRTTDLPGQGPRHRRRRPGPRLVATAEMTVDAAAPAAATNITPSARKTPVRCHLALPQSPVRPGERDECRPAIRLRVWPRYGQRFT